MIKRMKLMKTLGLMMSILILSLILVACGSSTDNVSATANQSTDQSTPASDAEISGESNSDASQTANDANSAGADTSDSNTNSDSEWLTDTLSVRFGEEAVDVYTAQMINNETAQAIVSEMGTSTWNLPIYHYGDFEGSDVMQYYDIPDSYDIPSVDVEHVTSEQSGDIYYSHPNRIILFYQDANVEGDYTKIGYIEDTEAYRQAVANNPVLQPWDTKIISVKVTQ